MSEATVTHDTHEDHGEKPLMAHGSILNTQITNGKIAIWLFLGSEVMFFTGLIGAYVVLRFKQADWADPLASDFPLNIGLTAFNTFLLICSSVTLVHALQSIQSGLRAKANWSLLWTTLFGATFVGIQAYEYYELWIQTDPVVEIRKFADDQSEADKANLLKLGDEMEADFQAAYATMKGPAGGFWSSPNITERISLSELTAEHVAGQDIVNKKTNETLVSVNDPIGETLEKIQALDLENVKVIKGYSEMWAGANVPPNKPYPDNEGLLEIFYNKTSHTPEMKASLDKFMKHVTDHDHFHWHKPTRPASDLFASCFYAMTSFHGFHVFIGVVAMGVLTVMGFMGKFGPDNYGVVEQTGLYWHFVDLVWIILFAIVYLM